MNFRKIISVLIGFGTIGLLSSILAKMQGIIFPSSLEIFTNPNLTETSTIQFAIKLLCVLASCVIGGMITTRIGGSIRENQMVGGLISLVVGWLWLSVIHPILFWLLLILAVFPAVFLGYKITYTMKK
ncbi:hypothetical protein [Chitinophaga sancti]|uniref:Uncharacterized protein n=1 Tax=Chitinophaga sancti TaxID=1004 RepID=A0A1K1PMI8_9BACT|nr:hypothetical protein [Chitinophaga sancti]WQD59523.1 hypothetical protein U0033_16645 [Chitinophaga sancti]WQG88342.1 hypothetical protein SR876_25820 [Chitinophaga sancti]SFW48651.1 hypothetical protein SAMN05661012_02103 [Chitinophaga sancti]